MFDDGECRQVVVGDVDAGGRTVLDLSGPPQDRFWEIFPAVSPGSEPRLLPALFCDRLPRMVGDWYHPSVLLLFAAFPLVPHGFGKRRERAVQVIMACRPRICVLFREAGAGANMARMAHLPNRYQSV